jgi:hypothetical protein
MKASDRTCGQPHNSLTNTHTTPSLIHDSPLTPMAIRPSLGLLADVPTLSRSRPRCYSIAPSDDVAEGPRPSG